MRGSVSFIEYQNGDHYALTGLGWCNLRSPQCGERERESQTQNHSLERLGGRSRTQLHRNVRLGDVSVRNATPACAESKYLRAAVQYSTVQYSPLVQINCVYGGSHTIPFWILRVLPLHLMSRLSVLRPVALSAPAFGLNTKQQADRRLLYGPNNPQPKNDIAITEAAERKRFDICSQRVTNSAAAAEPQLSPQSTTIGVAASAAEVLNQHYDSFDKVQDWFGSNCGQSEGRVQHQPPREIPVVFQ